MMKRFGLGALVASVSGVAFGQLPIDKVIYNQDFSAATAPGEYAGPAQVTNTQAAWTQGGITLNRNGAKLGFQLANIGSESIVEGQKYRFLVDVTPGTAAAGNGNISPALFAFFDVGNRTGNSTSIFGTTLVSGPAPYVTGSAAQLGFNSTNLGQTRTNTGDGAVVAGTYVFEWTATAGAAGQRFRFAADSNYSANTGNADTWVRVNRVQILTVPEPSVAILGGLGALALLRRRRA